MNLYWKKLSTTILFWLFSEIGLNFLGLDSLADYGEFIGQKHLNLTELDTFEYSQSKPLRRRLTNNL